jgi:hypothetical protein
MYISPYQILQLTPRAVRKRAVAAKPTILLDKKEKPTSKNQCRSIYMRVSLQNKDSTGLYHSCLIRIYGSAKDPKQYLMRPDSRMWVHCRCPYFLYYCEQALVRIKASSIYECEVDKRVTDPARQRNPRLVPYACKHLYAAITALLQEERNKKNYGEFVNKRNPYDGNYRDKMGPSFSR